jgi:hypothetical protein
MPNGFPVGFGILVPLAIAAIAAEVWAIYEERCLRQEMDTLLYAATLER